MTEHQLRAIKVTAGFVVLYVAVLATVIVKGLPG